MSYNPPLEPCQPPDIKNCERRLEWAMQSEQGVKNNDSVEKLRMILSGDSRLKLNMAQYEPSVHAIAKMQKQLIVQHVDIENVIDLANDVINHSEPLKINWLEVRRVITEYKLSPEQSRTVKRIMIGFAK